MPVRGDATPQGSGSTGDHLHDRGAEWPSRELAGARSDQVDDPASRSPKDDGSGKGDQRVSAALLRENALESLRDLGGRGQADDEPSVQAIIGGVGEQREALFAELQARKNAGETLTLDEEYALGLAAKKLDTVFLMLHTESFFEYAHAELVRVGESKGPEDQWIHFGLAGTSNYDIAAATKADMIILADVNENLLAAHSAMREVATHLVAERGLENVGPLDFIAAFEKHPIQKLLGRVRDQMWDQEVRQYIDLRLDLVKPESFLYQGQTDERFKHIMRLFSEGRVATVTLNFRDTQGFEDMAEAIGRCRNIPGLEHAEVKTAFTANLFWLMAEARPATKDGKDAAQFRVDLILDNLARVVPADASMIYATDRLDRILINPHYTYQLTDEGIIGPSYNDLLAATGLHQGEQLPEGYVRPYAQQLADRGIMLRPDQVAYVTNGHPGDFAGRTNIIRMGRFSDVCPLVPRAWVPDIV